MKRCFMPAAGLLFILLVACQSLNPNPLPTVGSSETPLTSSTPIVTAMSMPTATPIITATSEPTATALFTATSQPTATAITAIRINAFCTLIGKDPSTTVAHGTPINIVWGWDAKTEAQINDFLQNNITTITLDGKVIEGVSSGIVKNEKSGRPEVVWTSDVGVLKLGEHKITYDVKWKKIIDDGTNTYGPGSAHETEHDECQIVVK